jgi:hypothetical protein
VVYFQFLELRHRAEIGHWLAAETVSAQAKRAESTETRVA